MSKTAPRELVRSFPPIAAQDARVLVLGSMASVASLAKRQYYGHPRNAFWPIMGRLFGASPELPYAERKKILRRRGVAVWDVLEECYRVGSLDSSIERSSERPNDLAKFLAEHPRIGNIFFNGQKPETAYRRYALPQIAASGRAIRYLRLPSTSPAAARLTLEEKLSAWQAVRRAADSRRAPR